MTERLALMAAKQIRDLLAPSMPMVTVKGKRGKMKPVVFVQCLDGITRTVQWAFPEGMKPPSIPNELYGIEIKRKQFEGPAPKDIQKLGMKLFGAKK